MAAIVPAGPVARAAVLDGDRTLDHPGLVVAAARLAHAFADLGVGPGDRVAVALPNSAEFLVAGLAAAYARASFLPLNWHLKGGEAGWILADSAARVLVADRQLAPVLADAVPAGCAVVATELPAADGPALGDRSVGGAAGGWPGAVGWADTVRGRPGQPPAGAWHTPHWMFYTSGTTGRPKGVVHAGLDGAAMARAQRGLAGMWGLRPDDVYLLSGPGYHAGPGGYAFTHLLIGAAVAVLRDWDARRWCGLVARHRVSTTFLTPAHLIRLLELSPAERARADLTSLRLVIHGGAPCPAEVKRAAMHLLAPAELWELYGASEGGVTRISPDEWRARPGSVGRPWPGVTVRILAEDGQQLPPGRDGLIYVQPAAAARFHYHGDPAQTARAWRADAFTVGDVGHLDAAGYLYVTDRATDMVLWGGVNVYPREIEEVLHTHPAVVDCAVLGRPDPRYGERLVAVVELRRPVADGELAGHCTATLADFKCPAEFVVVPRLPRAATGKLVKRRLREWLVAGAAGRPPE